VNINKKSRYSSVFWIIWSTFRCDDEINSPSYTSFRTISGNTFSSSHEWS